MLYFGGKYIRRKDEIEKTMSENIQTYFSLGHFPDFVIVEILSYLSITDVISLGSVYPRINELSGEIAVAR